MRRIGASFMAMTAGWLAMNLVGLPLVSLLQGNPMGGTLSVMMWYGFFSSFVVGAAWLVIYLPIYAFLPTRSIFWRWEICIPIGLVVGALVPIVVFGVVDGEVKNQGSLGGAAMFSGMAAIVGGVAAAVGRWLFPWSRNYQTQWPDRKQAESGK